MLCECIFTLEVVGAECSTHKDKICQPNGGAIVQKKSVCEQKKSVCEKDNRSIRGQYRQSSLQ
jgi:hypothetical protein